MVRNKQPTPGAQAYAVGDFRLPTDALCGASKNTLGHLNHWQPPQVYVPNQMVPVGGIGGPTAGQIVGQPLFDLSNQGIMSEDVFTG